MWQVSMQHNRDELTLLALERPKIILLSASVILHTRKYGRSLGCKIQI